MKKTAIETTAFILDTFILTVILIALDFCWRLMEIVFDGGIQPSFSDTVMGVALAVFIWRHLALMCAKRTSRISGKGCHVVTVGAHLIIRAITEHQFLTAAKRGGADLKPNKEPDA